MYGWGLIRFILAVSAGPRSFGCLRGKWTYSISAAGLVFSARFSYHPWLVFSSTLQHAPHFHRYQRHQVRVPSVKQTSSSGANFPSARLRHPSPRLVASDYAHRKVIGSITAKKLINPAARADSLLALPLKAQERSPMIINVCAA